MRKHFLVHLGATGYKSLLSFYAALVAARALGPDMRGEFALLQTVVTFLPLVASLGLPQIHSVHWARLNAPQRTRLRRVAWLAAGLLGVGAIAATGVYDFSVPTAAAVLAVALITMVLLNQRERARGLGRIPVVATSLMIESTLIALSYSVLALVGADVLVWFVCFGLVQATALAYVGLACRRPGDVPGASPPLGGEFSLSASLANYSLTNILTAVAAQGPVLLMPLLSFSKGEIGLFAVASGLLLAAEAIPNSIFAVMLSRMNTQSDRQKLAAETNVLFRTTFAVLFAIGCAALVAVKFIVLPAIGSRYDGMIPVFLVLVLGYLFGSVGKALTLYFNVTLQERHESIAVAIRVVAQLLGCVVLGLVFGLIGFAAAITMSRLARLAYLAVMYLRATGQSIGVLVPRPIDAKSLLAHAVRGRN